MACSGMVSTASVVFCDTRFTFCDFVNSILSAAC